MRVDLNANCATAVSQKGRERKDEALSSKKNLPHLAIRIFTTLGEGLRIRFGRQSVSQLHHGLPAATESKQ